jgi:type IV pilus biogenesis protein PilP
VPVAQSGADDILPFPSMADKDGDAKKQIKPPPGQPLSLQSKKIEADMKRLENQVNTRLSQMRVGASTDENQAGASPAGLSASPGSGKLSPPNTSGYRDELDELAEEERQIRLLQLKQERASLAMKLWNTLYDPREFVNGGLVRPVEKSEKSGEDGKKEVAKTAPAPLPVLAPQPVDTPSLPYPKVLEISGTGGDLQATLLVPYLGEMNVAKGTVLPGGRRVEEVSSRGVMVNDPTAGIVPLGYGDSVPLAPTTVPPSAMGQMLQNRGGMPAFQQMIPPPMPPPPVMPNFTSPSFK